MMGVMARRTGYGPAVTLAPVVVYGTRWCAHSQLLRRHLDRLGVPYEYRDIDADPAAAARLRWWLGGQTSHPTVYIDGEILVEPSTAELDWALRRHQIA